MTVFPNVLKAAALLTAAAVTTAAAETPPDARPRIVCFGDSLTSCGGRGGRYSDWLQRSLPGYRVVNSGKGGDTLAGGAARFDEAVLRHRPVCVIVELGANDYWRARRTLAELERDYEAIVAKCRSNGMKVLIVSCFGNTVLPGGGHPDFDRPGIPREHYAAGLAAIERRLVAKYSCGYVPDLQCGITPKGRRDLWSDGNHPNARGNRIVAETILPELQKLLASPER